MRTWRALGTTTLLLALGATTACGTDDEGPDAASTATPSSTGSSSPTEPATPSSSTPESSSPVPTDEPTNSPVTTAPIEPSTSDAPVDLTRAPETYAEAQAHVEAAGIDGSNTSAKRFSTPGDVVYCVLSSTYIEPSCELRVGMIKDPAVCGRALSDFVGRVVLTASAAEPECNTDTIREPGAAIVQPSGVVRSGAVECAVESIGVTCIDGSHGFFITQGDYATF